jgi:hypothetical protein
MRRFRKVRPGSLVLILIFGFGSSLALTGCDSSSSAKLESKEDNRLGKSSMDYARKHVTDSKVPTKTKNRIPTH